MHRPRPVLRSSSYLAPLHKLNLVAEALRYGTRCQGISQFHLHTHEFIREQNEPHLERINVYFRLNARLPTYLAAAAAAATPGKKTTWPWFRCAAAFSTPCLARSAGACRGQRGVGRQNASLPSWPRRV